MKQTLFNRNAILILLLSAGLFIPQLGSAKMNPGKLSQIDREIKDAIVDGHIPGGVIWLESKGEIYHKAYGLRMKSPSPEAMTKDTVFDVASLTKVLATTPSILRLIEQGKLDLDAPISDYLPKFLEGGVLEESMPKEGTELTEEQKKNQVTPEHRKLITVKHLLTHQSGLPPGIFLSIKDFWGYHEGVNRAIAIGLLEIPGVRFRYSDVNFILLGEIIRRVSGERIDQFTTANFYEPLGMKNTSYLPEFAEVDNIAPTTFIEGYGLIRGQVHDPTARRMQGVAGHAGLFSTAEDIAKFMRLFIKGGTLNDVTLFQPQTINLATQNQLPATFPQSRGLGWDISSSFAYQRGEKFPRKGYGHTGWTGTSIWVDPASETFLIFLSNRNHPSEAGRIKKLRIKIGTLAGEAVGYRKPVPISSNTPEFYSKQQQTAAANSGPVLNGIDVLERSSFQSLSGLNVGLVTNHTGINRARRSTIDLLAEAPDVNLVALFSPEHGIRGTLDTKSIADGIDDRTGLPVHSLYKAKNRKPTKEQLKPLDALVFDIQDIGCRFYTYISTMGHAMEAAAESGKKFFVLDRVNPIGGQFVDGPIRTGTGNDFVAFHTIPVQHGMTAGELARMFNVEQKINVDLTVVGLEGWDARMRFDDTSLPWVNPSPNMRSVNEAILYPGIGLLEFTNISVGRGTSTPFEHIGAPWISEGRLATTLREESLPGVIISPTRFTPESSVYDGEDCGGVRFIITDRNQLRPIDLGLAIAKALHDNFPGTFDLAKKGNVLLRHQPTLDALLNNRPTSEIRQNWNPDFQHFLKRRNKFLLYPR